MQMVALLPIACVGGLWWFVAAKLLPRFRDGRVAGPYRTMFQLVIVLLVWASLEVGAFLFVAQLMPATAMLSVLWVTGLLGWAGVGAVNRTRRQVLEARAAAPTGGQWKVRTAPRVRASAQTATGAAWKSRTVMDIEAMEVQP